MAGGDTVKTKYFGVGALLLSSLLLLGCEERPEPVAEAFVRALYTDDAVKAVELIDMEDARVNHTEISGMVNRYVGGICDQASEATEKSGGILKIISGVPVPPEQPSQGSADKEQLEVPVKVIFRNRDAEASGESILLNRTPEGWKVVFFR